VFGVYFIFFKVLNFANILGSHYFCLFIQGLHKKAKQLKKPSTILAAQQDQKRITQNITIYLKEYNKKILKKLVKEHSSVE
jgi:hypothetical protein